MTLIKQVAEMVVEGKTPEEVQAQLCITEKMYDWLTLNDGFQLLLAQARESGNGN
jgi:hypothetical protein